MEQIGYHWTDIHEICGFSENMSRKFKFDKNLTKLTGTLDEDLRTRVTIAR